MYCWKCGKENRDSAAFCRYCGSPQTARNSGSSIKPTEENDAENTNNAEEQIQNSYTLPFNYVKLCPKCSGAMFVTEIPRTSISIGGKIAFGIVCLLIIFPLISTMTSPFGTILMLAPIIAIPALIYFCYQLYKHRSKTVLRCERCGYEEKE